LCIVLFISLVLAEDSLNRPDCNRQDGPVGGDDWDYNKCHPDSISSEEMKNYRYCMPVNVDDINGYNGKTGGADADYRCVECNSDCDCDKGQYCQNDDEIQENLYTCQSYELLIDNICSPDAQNLGGDALNDASEVFCGVIGSFLPTGLNEDQRRYQAVWQGNCVKQQCKACDSTFVEDANCNDPCYGYSCLDSNGNTGGLKSPQACKNNQLKNSASALTSWVDALY